MFTFNEKKKLITFNIKITPNSSQNKITDISQDYIKISIKSPAVENKANIELIKFLSKILGIKKNRISIRIGLTSKNKTIQIEKCTPLEFLNLNSAVDLLIK